MMTLILNTISTITEELTDNIIVQSITDLDTTIDIINNKTIDDI